MPTSLQAVIFCLWPVFSKQALLCAAWTLIPRLYGVTDWDFPVHLIRLSTQLDMMFLGHAPRLPAHAAVHPST
jgi:hypothetical protein